MTDEPVDNLIMISALQHYVFCPRQCALIHIEQTWAESGSSGARSCHKWIREGDIASHVGD